MLSHAGLVAMDKEILIFIAIFVHFYIVCCECLYIIIINLISCFYRTVQSCCPEFRCCCCWLKWSAHPHHVFRCAHVTASPSVTHIKDRRVNLVCVVGSGFGLFDGSVYQCWRTGGLRSRRTAWDWHPAGRSTLSMFLSERRCAAGWFLFIFSSLCCFELFWVLQKLFQGPGKFSTINIQTGA